MPDGSNAEGLQCIRVENERGPCVTGYFPDRDPCPFDRVYLNGRMIGVCDGFEIEVDEYRIGHPDDTNRTNLYLKVVLE